MAESEQGAADAGTIYLTASQRSRLPRQMRGRFRDLDQSLRKLMSETSERLLMVSPYLGPAGMVTLRDPIAVACSRGAWVRLVTGEIRNKQGMNHQAILTLLEGPSGSIIRTRLRVLEGTEDLPVLIHAKIVVSDGQRGYIGSANLSARALEENLELGVPLSSGQSKAIEDLVVLLEARGDLRDQTHLFA